MAAFPKPLPIPSPDTKPFWDGCRDHRLLFQKCDRCGHVRWPASFLCPRCLSPESTLTESPGTGRVYSFVVYHQCFHPGFESEIPYVVALVELDSGPRLLTNIVGCPPADVRCDLPVTVVWDDRAPGFSLPQFTPAFPRSKS